MTLNIWNNNWKIVVPCKVRVLFGNYVVVLCQYLKAFIRGSIVLSLYAHAVNMMKRHLFELSNSVVMQM